MNKRREKINNYKWLSITDDFFDSLNDLNVGEVVRDESFGLFEAMSAMEMMEPKMDSGLMSNRKKHNILSWEEAVDKRIISLDQIPNNVIIGVMDQILLGLMSWLEGDMLIQTVFINLYLHKPYLIQHKVMKALCLGVYKIIDVIKDIIYKLGVFEDEDFQSFQNGYKLTPDIEQTKMLDLLLKTELILDKKIKTQRRDKNKDLFNLHKRFQFIKSLHVCLVSFYQYTNNGEALMIIDLKNVISYGSHLLKDIIDSVRLYDRNDQNWRLSLGIQPMVNQRFLPPTFPKYTKNKSIYDTYKYFIKLFEDFSMICDVIHNNQFHRSLNFTATFNIKNPCLLSRSIVQLIYINHDNLVFTTIPFTKILKQSVISFNPPGSIQDVFNSPNLSVNIIVDDYIKMSVRYFKSLIRMFGYNRSRQREKMEKLLEEFRKLQEQTQQTDDLLKTQIFTRWIRYYTLKLINYYYLSGFELELYSYYEYLYIFWYLHKYLYSWIVDLIDTPEFASEKVFYRSLFNLTGGYFKAVCGFVVNGKIKKPVSEYDNEELRFINRFRFVKNLLYPPKVGYDEYKRMCDGLRTDADSSKYFNESFGYFKETRSLMDTLPSEYDVATLNNVAKTNLVVVKLLVSGYKTDSRPEFIFNIDKYFPIIKLN